MKLSKKILAGIVSAALLFTAMPAYHVDAAKIIYSGTYTKKITINKPEDTKVLPVGTIIDPTSPVPVAVSEGNADTVVKPQSETVSVMPGMKFAIAAKRYGTDIKTSKNKSQFKYKTSNKKVAKVTAKGLVTTLKTGKCDITVTNKKDGVKFVLHLKVAKKVKVSSLKLNAKSKKFKGEKSFGKTFQLTAKIKPTKYKDIPVLWGTTDDTVATVTETGLVTVMGFGECDIYCKAGSNAKTAKCRVTVIDPDALTEPTGVYIPLQYNTGKLVDISSFNRVVDWKKLKQSCDGVIIRVGYRGYGSEGNFAVDSQFRNNVLKCQQYGIPYSVYFWTNALNASEGAAEGDWIANTVSGLTMSMPVFIDVEGSGTGHGRTDNIGKSQRTTAVKATVQQLYNRGLTGGIYSSTYWFNNNLDMSQLQYPVWVAQYNTHCDYQGSKFAWQYTSSASGYGVTTGGVERCDVSWWYN